MANELHDGPWILWDMVEKRVYEYFTSQKTALTAGIGPNNQAKSNGQENRYVVLPNTRWKKNA